jgi:hypothetical protein
VYAGLGGCCCCGGIALRQPCCFLDADERDLVEQRPGRGHDDGARIRAWRRLTAGDGSLDNDGRAGIPVRPELSQRPRCGRRPERRGDQRAGQRRLLGQCADHLGVDDGQVAPQ